MAWPSPLDTCVFTVDCEIADIPPDDGTRMTARAVMHQGIFENPFSEFWTEPNAKSQGHVAIIGHVFWLCDFLE
jgi:hypothetical protein